MIKKNQIYKENKHENHQIITVRETGGKWLCKVLTNKPGVYNGTHKMSRRTLEKMFELIKE